MFAFDGFGPDVFVPFLVFSIPIIAIVGGITAGIVKTISHHRIIELAQRERIAMIERGLDPSKLPPLPMSDLADTTPLMSPADYARRRSQGLLIGGLVTLAVGLSLGVMLYFVADSGQGEHGVWAVGLIPMAIGIALLMSAFFVQPKNGN
jgi:hypothetical protein